MKKISVIIPVYKVENYLRACIDSVLASTYTNLEIILVDDGSPDNCPGICDEYAGKDARIKVIHQENQGVVSARNTGMRYATGDYVGFVDGDDLISPVMFERLATVLKQSDADLAACEYAIDSSKLLIQTDAPAAAAARFDTYDGQLAVLTCAPAVRSVTWTGIPIWNKLYRRELICFPFRSGYTIGEDLMFNWEYIANSRSMAILAEPLYFYRQNPQSAMGAYNSGGVSEASARKGVSVIKLWDHLERNSPVVEPSLRDYLYARAAYMSHGGLWHIFCAGLENSCPDAVSQAQRLIHDHAVRVFRDRETYTRKIGAIVCLCRYFFPLWVAAAKLYAVVRRA